MDMETDDPEKGQLLQRSAHHREAMEEEVKLISEQTEKIITSAIVVGGALAITYFLVTRLSGSNEKAKVKYHKTKLINRSEDNDSGVESIQQPEEAGLVSQIGAALVAQATTYLLTIAKEKLMEFIESQSAKKGNYNGHS